VGWVRGQIAEPNRVNNSKQGGVGLMAVRVALFHQSRCRGWV
jgi:hypothetical protein